jgi:hypothetical protein
MNLTAKAKIFLFVCSMGFALACWFLLYRMSVEIKDRAPQTKVIWFSGAIPVMMAHRRVLPQSWKRVEALISALMAFILFVLSADAIFR